MWPQITVLSLLALKVAISLARYGEPREGEYNALDVWAVPAIWIALLGFGGFFSCFGWAP